MKPRSYKIYAAVIAVLLAVNLGRWWLQSGTTHVRADDAVQVFSSRDLSIRANVPVAVSVRRDLFAPATATAISTTVVRPVGARVRTEPVAQVPPPQPSAGPTDIPVAEPSNLNRLALLGIVYREGKGQAYLSLDKNHALAHSGDAVFGQYTVEKISVDSVELRDLKNNVTRRIPVSGK